MKTVERAFLSLALLAALAVRLCFNDSLSGFDLSSANYDGVDYHWLAVNLCRMRGYHTFFGTGHDYHLLRSPGYPLYIAAVYLLCGVRVAALKAADAALSSFSVVLLYLVVRELAGRKAAALSAAIAVFYRPAAYYATRLFSENLFCALMLLALLLLLRSRGAPSLAGAAGAVTGYMVLTRPAWLGVAPFLLAWAAAQAGRRAFRTCLFAAGGAAAVAPWVVYCWFSLGIPPSPAVFSSALGAENAWAAHNPALGDFTQRGPEAGRDFEHEWTQLTLRRFRDYRMSEAEYIASLTREARRFLRSAPLRCLALGARRVYRSWLGSGIMDGQGTVLPDTGTNPYGVTHWRERIFDPAVYLGDAEVVEQAVLRRPLVIGGVRVPLVSFEGTFYLMALAACACALAHLRRLPSRAWGAVKRYSLVLATAIGYAAANLFGIPIQRYRLPVDYCVIIAAGAFLACAGEPLFRAAAGLLRRLGVGTPRARGAAVPAGAGGGLPRAYLWGLAAAVALAAAGRAAATRAGVRQLVLQRCAVRPSAEALASALGAGPGEVSASPAYRAVWRRGMEGEGDLGPYLGQTVVWRGEATWINGPARADFAGEYWLARARQRYAPGMPRPGFFRMIVDSYERPDSIGSGRVIVVAAGDDLERLREGDGVAVRATLAGTDYLEGSLILCAQGIVTLNGPLPHG